VRFPAHREERAVAAVELFPQAVVAHQAGDLDTAERAYRQILQDEPQHAAALTNLGVLLVQRGQFQEAAVLYEAAVRATPNLPDAHFNLGNLYRRLNRLSEAAMAFENVLRLVPDHARAHLNLGLVVSDGGNWPTAAECFRRAVVADADIPEGFHLLWDALTRLSRIDEAEQVIRAFVTRCPDDPRGHLHLGLSLAALRRTDEAIPELETSLQLRPDSPEVHNALGVAFDDVGRADEANQHYREAVRLRPDYADAWSNLGISFSDQGRVREAADVLKKALDLRPDPVLGSNRLVLLLASSGVTPQRLRGEHEAWAAQYAAKLLPDAGSVRYPDPGPRLRVGYVFAELRTHAATAFLETLLTRHDRSGFHITCYPNYPNAIAGQDRLRRLADSWKPLAGLTDAAATDLIRADEIDILVDLTGHTAGNRLLVFARKPARVQMTCFGYPCTTGLAAIDYRLTDAFADPVGISDMFGTEKLLRLPAVGRLYVPPVIAPPPNSLPASSQRAFTFGCLNSPGKLSDACLDTWARVLKAVPKSRLVLQAGRSVEAARRLTERFTRLGVSSDRIELTYRLPEHEYLEAYQPLDAALDPFPFNGRATTCDALWMGVPVLTLTGADSRGRQGASILQNVGLPDFVADTLDKFVELAATWADQRDALADLRGALREMLAASPVTDATGFVRNLEAAYTTAIGGR